MDDKSELFESIDEMGTDEPTLYEKAKEDQGRLMNFLDRLPGLRGYRENERRRDADQLLRQTVAARLTEARLQLSNVHQTLSKDIILAIDFAEPLGRIDTRLRGLIGKIESAPTGYSGFWDAGIREEELAQIYAFDEQLFDHAELIAASVAALEKAVKNDGDVNSSVSDLDSAVQNAGTALNARTELLSGFTAG